MHLLVPAENSAADLKLELATWERCNSAQELRSDLLKATFDMPPGTRLPDLVFCRQLSPEAHPVFPDSIRAWADQILEKLLLLPEGQPWAFHLFPRYAEQRQHRIGARAWHSTQLAKRGASMSGSARAVARANTAQPEAMAQPASVPAEAGHQRCRLIRDAVGQLLRRKRRHLLRCLLPGPKPFRPSDSLVQVMLTAPDSGWISIASAPIPFQQRHLISFLPGGEWTIAADKAAPSRAFAKLLEAESRWGRAIIPGATCVDLGAAPGSWTYVAVNRGAWVIAVDHSALREDLMQHPKVRFEPGDAFRFQPETAVDWLLCDVIAPPDLTAGLLVRWLHEGWCRNFVATLKLKDDSGLTALNRLKCELPLLAKEHFLLRLCANKKEACAFGCRV
jgi:23S rRNA (cytidine2498-2'-O)-methyltransferase